MVFMGEKDYEGDVKVGEKLVEVSATKRMTGRSREKKRLNKNKVINIVEGKMLRSNKWIKPIIDDLTQESNPCQSSDPNMLKVEWIWKVNNKMGMTFVNSKEDATKMVVTLEEEENFKA